MLSFKKVAIAISVILWSQLAVGQEKNHVTILCYHDIVETREEAVPDAVYLDKFIEQLEWLKSKNIPVISLDELAQADEVPLPENAVMLTFDDGYISFYEKVYPLLLQYEYPAILAVVNEWMKGDQTDSIAYGDTYVPRANFVTWNQVAEMSASGLVNIASHSHNGHRGILSNPQGNSLPFFTATKYDSIAGYESEDMYLERVKIDLSKSTQEIERHTGIAPNAMVWPFGRYNDHTVEIANELGMEYTFALNYLPDRLRPDRVLNRFYMDLSTSLEQIESWIIYEGSPIEYRFLTGEIDDITSPEDSLETELGTALSQLYQADPNLLFLETSHSNIDEEGVYFNTNTTQTIADKQTRIIWQAQSRIGSDVHLIFSEELLRTPDHSKFFNDMGRFSPVKGVLMEDAKLLDQLKNTAEAQTNVILTPQTRRDLRRSITDQFQSLQYLDHFQTYQPILEVGLSLDINSFIALTKTELADIHNFFDYLYIDMSSIPIKKSVQILSSVDIPKPLRRTCLLKLNMSEPKKLSKLKPMIEAMGYVSYGFDISLLDTPWTYFVASSSYPYKQ